MPAPKPYLSTLVVIGQGYGGALWGPLEKRLGIHSRERVQNGRSHYFYAVYSPGYVGPPGSYDSKISADDLARLTTDFDALLVTHGDFALDPECAGEEMVQSIFKNYPTEWGGVLDAKTVEDARGDFTTAITSHGGVQGGNPFAGRPPQADPRPAPGHPGKQRPGGSEREADGS